MKHLFKIASLILPMLLLSSCGGAKNYPYEGETIGQGREAAKKYLKENPDKLTEIDSKVREAVKANENL